MAGRIVFMAPMCAEYNSNLKDLISGNSFTYTSAPTFHASGGIVYDSYVETKTGNKVVMPFSDSVSTDHSSTSFCAEAWVMMTQAMGGDSRYIFRFTELLSPEYTASAMLGLSPSSGFYTAIGTGPADMSINVGGSIPALNTWVHLAMSFHKPTLTLRLFVNGNLVKSGVAPSIGAIIGQPAIYIGHDPANTSRSWIGGIQDVRLTFDDVRYTANFTPPTRLTKELGGTTFRQDGLLPAPYTLVRNSSSLATKKYDVDATGKWGFLAVKGSSYDISYMADGLKPEIHGPYIV